MLRSRVRWVCLLTAFAVGCAFMKDLGIAFGEGALEGVAYGILDEGGGDQWGKAYNTRGVGVGVAARSAEFSAASCAGVTDEFEDLYRGDVLQNPRLHVPTVDRELSEARFHEIATTGGLRLTGERAGGVIGVVRTGEGHLAKFVAHFPEAADVLATLRDLTVYDAEGDQVLREVAGPLELSARLALDLDPTGAEVSSGGSGAWDLLAGPDADGNPALIAAAGAAFSAPTRSLCSTAPMP